LAPSGPSYFEDHIAPLLAKHCVDCHDDATFDAKLDLSTAEGLMRGSESGPVVAAGSKGRSLLYEMVHSGEMPREAEKLSEQEIELIGHWIDAGLKFRRTPAAAELPLAQHDVLPILLLRCAACHGAQLQRGDLDLRSISALRQGGSRGPAAVAGDPDASLMIRRAEEQLCPPSEQMLKYFVERPTAEELGKLRRWIAEGMREVEVPPEVTAGAPDSQAAAAARGQWAFHPLPRSVPVPEFAEIALADPIDAFIYAELRKQGLDFSPQAEKSELIRRAYLDLIGMPPGEDELLRWERQTDDGWYAAMIDHLLASPQYGERWGRHWLDVAGYADSEGGQSEDPVRLHAWKYRDYVIRSFNADKPWDRFLKEQLAGDELADYTDPSRVTEEVIDNLIATGFLRMGIDETGSRTMNFVPERLGLIGNALTVVSSGVLGLTLDCARCHSHKYDPIPQTDYYRFKALFQGAFDEHDWMSWKTRQLDVETPSAAARRKAVNTAVEAELTDLEAERKSLVAKFQKQYYDSAWPKLTEEEQVEFKAALKARTTRRTPRQQELIEQYEREIRPNEAVLAEKHADFAAEIKRLDADIAAARGRLIEEPTIRALWDRGNPSPTYVLLRGEYNRPGRLVGPGVPSALTDGKTPLKIVPPPSGASSTGRRLALAEWFTKDDHPLTARVLVNRVWSLHFGRGIVKTLDNFGKQGALPTHPELLDWLARDFVSGGWSVKSLHRRIMLSRTYRQSSRRNPAGERVDPENKLLGRMTLRRLDAEALRDSLLSVSGRLDATMFGPPAPVDVRDDGLVLDLPASNGDYRRSIYLQLRRTEMPTMLSSFDYPEMQPNCSERSVSTVSTQSLILMNNSRVYELAGSFADQLSAENEDDAALVVAAYRRAFCRSPHPAEVTTAVASLARMSRLWIESGADAVTARRRSASTFCHTLLNCAEFTYVD